MEFMQNRVCSVFSSRVQKRETIQESYKLTSHLNQPVAVVTHHCKVLGALRDAGNHCMV